jgi:hypothetical protein
VDRDERPPGQLGPLRWQQLGEHGLTGEGVAEPEPLAVHGDELGVDGSTQRPDHGRAVDRGDTGKQVPVEPPAQHGRGGEHMPGVVVECPKPGAQRCREAGGYGRGGCLLGPPSPVLPRQRSRRDQPGQQLLDQEGQPVAVLGDEGGHGMVHLLGAGQAGAHHVRAVTVGEGSEGEDSADPAASEPVQHVRDVRGSGRPGRGQAQNPLGGEGVGEVVDDRQRLRVRPVQVLEHEQTPCGTAEHPEQPDHRFADEHGGVVGAPGRLARAPVRHEPGELAAEPGELG